MNFEQQLTKCVYTRIRIRLEILCYKIFYYLLTCTVAIKYTLFKSFKLIYFSLFNKNSGLCKRDLVSAIEI